MAFSSSSLRRPVSSQSLSLKIAAVACAGLATWLPARGQDFRVEPYLQNPTSDAVTIRWLSEGSDARAQHWQRCAAVCLLRHGNTAGIENLAGVVG